MVRNSPRLSSILKRRPDVQDLAGSKDHLLLFLRPSIPEVFEESSSELEPPVQLLELAVDHSTISPLRFLELLCRDVRQIGAS